MFKTGPPFVSEPYAASFDHGTINSPRLMGGFMEGAVNKDVVGMAVY